MFDLTKEILILKKITHFDYLQFKWRIFSQTSTEKSGKNKQFWCFESNFFLSKSCPELSNQVHTQFFRRSNLLEVWSLCATIGFQLFDIWWSSLDKINDFKAISRMVFFRFGEINKSWFLVLSKKIFF